MTTKKVNSKGKMIEELEIDTDSDTRGPFQSPKPVSPKRNIILEKKEPPLSNEESPQKINMDAIEELIAWSTYYLNYKKNNRKLSHIYF
jgi:hypothetical protein